MKKFFVFLSITILSLSSFVSCSYNEGDAISMSDTFIGVWQYTNDYTSTGDYFVSSEVKNGYIYNFKAKGVVTTTASAITSTGVYLVSGSGNGSAITYTDNGEPVTKKFRIQGDKLYLYTTTTSSAGVTTETGIILTKKDAKTLLLAQSDTTATLTANGPVGSGSGEGSSTDASQLLGKWLASYNYTIVNGSEVPETLDITWIEEFKSDGTTDIIDPTTSTVGASGTYTVSGTSLTVSIEGLTETGTYKISNGKLYIYEMDTTTGTAIETGTVYTKVN